MTSIRQDKFSIGDKVSWSPDYLDLKPDGLGDGPFTISKVYYREYDPGYDDGDEFRQSNWSSMGHTQHVELAEVPSNPEKESSLFSGALLIKISPPMTPETLTALQSSITHWERNVAAKTPYQVSLSWKNCALCKLFFESLCKGCPVKLKTKKRNCGNTPYQDCASSYPLWCINTKSEDAHSDWQKAAQSELDFLKSLLPQP